MKSDNRSALQVMKRPFAATIWREGNWYVSQCLEFDIASQGESQQEALANLKEALELHFEPPYSTRVPEVRMTDIPGLGFARLGR